MMKPPDSSDTPTGDLTPSDPGPTRDFETAGGEPGSPSPSPSPSLSPSPSASAGAALRSGDAVGPYTLLEQIGEGGFGEVWLAERREPMVQRVALKVLKPGMDSRAVVARFEQERQALAVMDHPHVARVFDGGATAAGRPYFVMEYVKGETITAYADGKRLTLRERLELFIPVCEAVQHAHHKGLIHRDLKPSNVLVAEVEGKHVPKVIDFGVAKAIAGEGWTDTAHTQSGVVIGTPLYMSPEQVAGEVDVDTRSDVYALGAMLYELLTGEAPFDAGMLRKAALAEVQRVIREETPPKPSTRVAQLGDARTTTVAEARSASRERIAGELRRELDWIPLMALRKERERRYESPQALADDLRRYLDGRPLRAAPESRAYLARKFVRRNRVQVLAAAAVFLALGTGLVVALWQRNEAIRAKESEAERFEQLQQVADFQLQMLEQINTTTAGIELMKDVRERFAAALERSGVPEAERAQRVDALRQELTWVNATDAAAAMIDRTILKPAIDTIDEQFKDQPAVDAQLRQALADLYRLIGLYDAALPLQESALATRRRVLGDDDLYTMLSTSGIARLLEAQGRFDEAEPYYRQALEGFRRKLGEEHSAVLAESANLGGLLRAQGKIAESEPYYHEAFEKSRRLLGEEHPETLTSINNLGALLESQGKLQEAESLYRRCLEIRRRVLGQDHPDTIVSTANLAGLLLSQSRYDEAEAYSREVLEKHRRLLGEEHPDTLLSINSMGFLLMDRGRLAEAEPYFRECLEKRRRVLGESHPDTLTSIGNLGYLLQEQGKLADAESFFREVMEASRRVLGADHPDTIISMNNLGVLVADQGRWDEAEQLLRKALDGRRRVFGEDHPDTLTSINNMGVMLQVLGRFQEAEQYCREALEGRRRTLGEENAETLVSLGNMGSLLQDWGRPADAEPYLRESLEKRRRILGEEHPLTLGATANLGTLLRSLNRTSEAEPYLREAFEKRRRVLGLEHPDTLRSATSLGRVLAERDESQTALDLLSPFEIAARKQFTGGNAPRLAEFLTTLNQARVGVGYEPERFRLAESNLVEAYPIFLEAKDRGPFHAETLACVRTLVDLYTAWDKAEPGNGHDARAAEWRAKLDASQGK